MIVQLLLQLLIKSNRHMAVLTVKGLKPLGVDTQPHTHTDMQQKRFQETRYAQPKATGVWNQWNEMVEWNDGME